jgi:dCMP deaminase
MDKWDKRFMDVAEMVASWSKDPSTKVGAVIVDDNRRIVGTGYNGFPRGVLDHAHRYNNRPLKYEMVVHAEANAILNATQLVSGATLYCTLSPCHECAKLIIQAGIRKVVYKTLRDNERTTTMFQEAGVQMGELNDDDPPIPVEG